jgi:hypothetical protein
MPLSSTSGFTDELKKKIDKTKEARNGEGVYKRRNRRDYRVVMQLSTYKKIYAQNKSILDKYEEGYAIRVKPEEYFQKNGSKQQDFPPSLQLGLNAFIYFKTITSWNIYNKFCSDFREVVELKTQPGKTDIFGSWIGDYCNYVKNSILSQLSLICSTSFEGKKKKVAELKEKIIKEGFALDKNNSGEYIFPDQAGLGNFDYDYASKEEINNVRYQMAYLIYKVPNMKKELKSRLGISEEQICRYENHVESYCEEKKLIDFTKLVSIKAWDESKNIPICPLCKNEITANEFFTDIEQDEGREEEDNTQTAIELMHIRPLKPGEFNHCTYNLGWGHKHCNIIQGNLSINETLDKLKAIMKSNGM